MLKIRLMRIGTKKKPFYRVVVVDERSKRTGGYIELVGTYNPLTEPKDIKLKQDRIDYWTKQGAQPSTGYLRIIGKAPQRPPRKPKKAGKQGADKNAQIKPEEPAKEATTEEVKSEKIEEQANEAPVEETPSEEAAKPVTGETSEASQPDEQAKEEQGSESTEQAEQPSEPAPANEEESEKKDAGSA